MKKGIIAMIGLMQICISQKLIAQEKTLDPVTVSSSLIEKRSSETGRNITIISGETISKLPVHSLDELLKYVPGVEVQSRGPQGTQSDISMRGGTYQQVLVVLDGLRLNDPNTGHFSAYIPITPAQIDRIEVLKGASAAIYGSDAVGGVINIITKTYNASKQQHKKILNASVGAGEYHLVNTTIGGFLQSGNLSMDAGLLSNHSTGVPQRGTNGFFHNTTASAGINYRLSEYWNISARTAYDNRDFGAQNFYTTFVSDTASEHVKSWWHQLRLAYSKYKTKITMDAGYKKLDDEFLYNRAATANQNTSKLFQSLLTLQQKLTEQTDLVAGFNFQNKHIASNDRGNHSLNIVAPFVSVSQKIGAYFSVQPSLRAELIGKNSVEFLPQLNASLHLPNLQLRASGGRTIRDADFTERYNNYNKPLVNSGSIGNPWLVPEVSWAFEAGADWFYQSNFKLSSTFFKRYHSKLIDWVTTPYANMPRKDNLNTTGTFALASNIAKVNTTGFETDLQYINRFSDAQQLILNAGLVWLYSESSEANPSFYISSHAKFLSNFNIIYQFGNAMISVTGIYKNRNPRASNAINAAVSKDYFVLNGRASYNFLKNRLGAFVQMDNMLDRQYSDLLGAPLPGRWLQGGFSFRLAR
ncbi:MAG TPA: TonB-dependent receptor [Niabella sp.]|nr:TonB-dependent receptor [Niabella sp.]HOZ96504.1 TonB-dependent receptor [Niabella sp.]HQW13315.1 TonB-dependent receptor [Niabella sp.]HQX18645.1 TonB-dependent receptor [Niabella sp.]HQX40298.1 TonB-dependent receptor [Niabella sp.]